MSYAIVTPPVEVILAKAPGDASAVMTINDNLTHSGVSYRRYAGGTDLDARLRASALTAFDVWSWKRSRG